MTQAGYEKLGDEWLSHTSPAKDMVSAPPPPLTKLTMCFCKAILFVKPKKLKEIERNLFITTMRGFSCHVIPS